MHPRIRVLSISFALSSFVLLSGGCGDDDSSTGCCVALPGQDQGVCDSLESLGEDRCNMINSGATCTWSASAECVAEMDAGRVEDASGIDGATVEAGPNMDGGPGADSGPGFDGGPDFDGGPEVDGGPDTDAGMPEGCCLARSGADQSACDEVEPFGEDRCNMVNDGETCGWSTGAECDPVPSDACCVALAGMPQAQCDEVESQGEARCNAVGGGEACAWSDVPECARRPSAAASREFQEISPCVMRLKRPVRHAATDSTAAAPALGRTRASAPPSRCAASPRTHDLTKPAWPWKATRQDAATNEAAHG